jgi:hypothetical protein
VEDIYAAVDNLRSDVANEKHLRLSWGGDYVPSTLPGEIWENNLNLILNFGSTDHLGTLPSTWSVVPYTVARTETDWTIQGNWYAEDGPDHFKVDDFLNDQVAPAITDFMAAAHLSNQVRCRWAKIYPIGAPSGNAIPAPGFTTGTPIALEWTSSYPTGGESSTQLPPQDAIALSLNTYDVGPRSRGRIFLPSSTSSSMSQAKVSSTAVDDIVAAGQAFLAALHVHQIGIAQVSDTYPIVTGKPWNHYAIVNSVRVGNIMDTQRRRRDRLTEVYTSGAVTY